MTNKTLSIVLALLVCAAIALSVIYVSLNTTATIVTQATDAGQITVMDARFQTSSALDLVQSHHYSFGEYGPIKLAAWNDCGMGNTLIGVQVIYYH